MGVAVAAEPAVNRCNGFPELASDGSSVATVETVERRPPRPGTPMDGGVNETHEELGLTPSSARAPTPRADGSAAPNGTATLYRGLAPVPRKIVVPKPILTLRGGTIVITVLERQQRKRTICISV